MFVCKMKKRERAKREDVQKVVDGNESCVLRVRRIYKRTDIDSCNIEFDGRRRGGKFEISLSRAKRRNKSYGGKGEKCPL